MLPNCDILPMTVQTYRAMFWPAAQTAIRPLSAELLFQYHKLEKGLAMPGEPRLFGLEPAEATMALLRRWRVTGIDETNSVFVGAVEALVAYHERAIAHGLDPIGVITPKLREFLADFAIRDAALSTLMALPAESAVPTDPATAFRQLTLARRSVRNFSVAKHQLIRNAVEWAQLAPSACNRQPCRIQFAQPGRTPKCAPRAPKWKSRVWTLGATCGCRHRGRSLL